MSTLRQRFISFCMDQLGKPVLWAAKGDYFVDLDGKIRKLPVLAYDCSGLVTCGINKVGITDMRNTMNAQRLWDLLPSLEIPAAGDLGFYGHDDRHVIHVVIALAGEHVLSADGASQKIRTLDDAKAMGARVRVHQHPGFYRSAPFLGWRRNSYLDTEETHA